MQVPLQAHWLSRHFMLTFATREWFADLEALLNAEICKVSWSGISAFSPIADPTTIIVAQ